MDTTNCIKIGKTLSSWKREL